MTTATATSPRRSLLAGLAHVIARRRRLVIGAWIVLTLFGAFSAQQVSKRWFESFSIPGYSAYETNQRTLKTFGTGEQAPLVAVFRSEGDVTKEPGIENDWNQRFETWLAAKAPKSVRRSQTPTTARRRR